jgi:glycosyltransferase involved in cell wall biosynthesis
MLDDQVTGLHFAPGDADALAQKVTWAWTHLPELAAMGKAARKVFEDRYTANANYHLLMKIYDSAIDTHRRFKRNRRLRAAA